MKIAILGNGKMGSRISKLAIDKGHKVVCISNSNKPARSIDLGLSDVAIDFSIPSTAFENISHAINSGIPVISGTTGWLDRIEEINNLCTEKEGAFLYASNFSLGVNIFFEINKKIAEIMKKYNYKSEIYEVHHTQKLDKPSGTAITLAAKMEKILKNDIKIISERTDENIGTHQISYRSELDEIKINHIANNRDGFAIGAIMAAEWIIGKKGIYSINDIYFK